MPSICPAPGCGRITAGGRCGGCAADQRRKDNARRNSHPRRAVYDDPRWPRTRAVVLVRDDFSCQECGTYFGPEQARKLVCAHTDPGGVLAVIDAGRNPFDAEECQCECLRCSGRKDGARSRS